IAPAGFVEYLTKQWMRKEVLLMWSGVYRKYRNIFELCDTNRELGQSHQKPPGKFLQGKRNRRIDHLLHVFLNRVLPYYALKQRRQDFGFEDPDVEIKKRQDIEK
ncbi:hypothetical protein K438DRAFT_1479823, partial [Mycena galopus ATCC 62051]